MGTSKKVSGKVTESSASDEPCNGIPQLVFLATEMKRCAKCGHSRCLWKHPKHAQCAECLAKVDRWKLKKLREEKGIKNEG